MWLRRCRGYAGRHVDDGETSFDRRYGLLVDPTFVDTILRRDDEFAGTYLADGPFNFRGKDVSIAPALHVAALSGHVQVPIVKDNDVFVVVAIHHFPFINLTKAPGFSSRARRDLPQPLGANNPLVLKLAINVRDASLACRVNSVDAAELVEINVRVLFAKSVHVAEFRETYDVSPTLSLVVSLLGRRLRRNAALMHIAAILSAVVEILLSIAFRRAPRYLTVYFLTDVKDRALAK